ncbi:DUF2125 domain-containing protein [Acidisoma cladoniae]|uniref:DUF2125 domain-containing protein n=1 Tax=Acidisoma cladoniae TaxID=3040935 RepID=UPI00254B1798|nr:DUF2125 domain-containing protein [Acidisoma sp. PAMC 29798]
MTKRRRIRRVLAGLILLLILVGAAWTGVWFIVAGRLADHLAAWEQQEKAQGWTITHGTPSRTGWPMAAGITLPDFSVTGGDDILPGGIAWNAEAVTLALDIRHPNDLFVGVTGREQIRVAQAAPIPFQATRLTGQVEILPGDTPGLVQTHATGVLAAFNGAALSVTDVNAALRADGSADAEHDALIVAATATGIGLPPSVTHALGSSVKTFAFDAAVTGPVPLAGAAPDPVAAANGWRDAGGSLTLRALHLDDAPLVLDAQGRFQLDATLKPTGDLAVHAVGLNASLDRMAAARDIPHSVAVAVKAMLGLLITPANTLSPEKAPLDATLSLRDGLISLGAIPLLRLPD